MEKLRTRKILEYLRKRKTCSLEELRRKFRVSSATIHRDVAELTQRDAVTAVRGGLVFNEIADVPDATGGYSDRVVANRAGKIAAARKALSAIAEGDIVFLDSSTTVYELAMLLRGSSIAHLTIVTNSVSIMQNFRKLPREWVLIALGGNYDAQLNSMLGSAAVEQLKAFNITKCFVSAFGLDAKNATTNHERQADLIRQVLDAAERRYLVVDRSKRGRTGLYRICARGAFDAVFSE